ncbi:HEPN domain-containing protein [Methylocystis sp. SC2]|uniref:HEPN domain-containing protein n=1 Tax=Methylocystis sp. (strain SC2) TaxID=187303 RepID=UPI00027AF066|nr:HEPN domain-containing protein [Methylocystis sp. SC2]CCJ08272.1 Hypothetical protein BN69_2821 [Methylocystis sp. SC2]
MLRLLKHELLTDKFPPSDTHNDGARILRRGLSVSAFSLLECYLEDRLEELTAELSRCCLNYSDFGEKLQKFLTVDALLGLGTRINFEKKSSRQRLVESFLPRIAGYALNPPLYTAIGFSPKGSNVSKDDIKAVLSALGREDAWNELGGLARLIGSSRISLDNDYSNLASTRHSAAHDSSTNIPTSDLQSHLESIIVIGITFDVLATTLVKSHQKAKSKSDLPIRLTSLNFPFRFLDEQVNGKWYERRGGSTRTIKAYASEPEARLGATRRRGGAFVILRDPRQIPMELI